jgi:mono/diheme cytochrome c family protein
MRCLGSGGCLLLVAALAAGADKPLPPGPVPGQAKPAPAPADPGIAGVSGAYAYRTYCASCHGADLRFRPPDLSLMAKRNGGEYPAETVHRIVDGRRPLPGHGGPDMPIWGDAFKNPETGFDEAKVREKIRVVVDHLRTLQVPARN